MELEVNVAPSAQNPESTLLHEIQHIIQGYEKWAPGGAQSTVYQNMSQEQRNKEIPKVMEQVVQRAEEAIKKAGVFDTLRALPKEVIVSLSADRRREKDMYSQVEKVRNANYLSSSPEYRAVYDGWRAFSDRMEENKATVLAQYGLDPTDIDNKVILSQIINGENPTAARDGWNAIALKEQNKKAALESGDETAIVNALKEANVLYRFYKRLAGEVEARTTQYRQKLTPEQRSETSPASTLAEQYDETAPGDEIVIPREGGNSEQASPMPSVVDSFTARREKQLNGTWVLTKTWIS